MCQEPRNLHKYKYLEWKYLFIYLESAYLCIYLKSRLQSIRGTFYLQLPLIHNLFLKIHQPKYTCSTPFRYSKSGTLWFISYRFLFIFKAEERSTSAETVMGRVRAERAISMVINIILLLAYFQYCSKMS